MLAQAGNNSNHAQHHLKLPPAALALVTIVPVSLSRAIDLARDGRQVADIPPHRRQPVRCWPRPCRARASAACDRPSRSTSASAHRPPAASRKRSKGTSRHRPAPEACTWAPRKAVATPRSCSGRSAPQNLDVFIGRLARAGLLVFDPLVEELGRGGAVRAVPEWTA